MKICPKCQQTYPDNQGFCLNDGTALNFANAGGESEPETVMMNSTPPPTNPNQSFGNASQQPQNNWSAPHQQQQPPQFSMPPQQAAPQKGGSKTWILILGILGVLLLLCGGGLVGAYYWLSSQIDNTINTINTYSSPTPSTTNTSTSPSTKTDSKLTMNKYNQVKNGMSYTEVVNILGVEGTETSNSEIGKYKTVSYKWDGENYSFIVATFQNDKLLFKTQYGLK